MNKKISFRLIVFLFLLPGVFFISCTPKVTKPSTFPQNIPGKDEPTEIGKLVRESFKFYDQGKFTEAVKKLETATKIILQEPPSSTISLYTLLEFFQDKSGNTEKARVTYTTLRDLFQKIKSDMQESEALAQRLIQFAQQLKPIDRIQFWQRLRPIVSVSHGKPGESGVLWQIGETYLTLKDFLKAYECGIEALKLAKDSDNLVLEVNSSIVILKSLLGLGRIQEAEGILDEVLPKTTDNLFLRAVVLAQFAFVQSKLGRGEEQTVKYYKDAIARSSGITVLEVILKVGIGAAYLQFGKKEKGKQELLNALAIREKIGNKYEMATLESGIANIFGEAGLFEEAHQYALRAADTYKKLGNRIEEAKCLRIAGQNLGAQNKIDEAMKLYEKAALIQVDEKDRDSFLETLWSAVILLKNAGRNEIAKQVLLIGLNTHTSVFIGDVEGERQIRWELAIVCKELGHFSEALEHFDKVFSIYDKLGDRKGKILTLIEMAQIYGELNDYKERINFLSFAETLGTEIDDPFINLMILTHTARFFADVGNKVEALQRHLEALKISRLVSKQAEREQSLQVGHFYGNIGEYVKALPYFEEGLKIAKEIGDQTGIARSLIFIAGCYQSMNRPDDAIRSAREAIEIIKATQSTMFEEWHAWGVIGFALEDQENYEDALRINQDRLKVAEKLGGSILIKDTLCDIGRIYFEMGKYTEAIENFKGATQTVELLRRGVLDQENKMGFLSKHLSPYDGIVHASFELHRKSDYRKKRLAEEALEFSEKSKARTWTEQLWRSRGGLIQESVPLGVRNEEKDFINKFMTTYQEYENALTRLGISAKELKEKEKTKDIAWGKWKSFQEKIRRQFPGYALLRYHVDRPIKFSELTVKAEETLILYKVTEDWIYAWVVRRIGGENKILKFTRLPSKTFEIEKIVEKLLSPFGRGKYKEFDAKLSNELFDKILKPVLDGVEITKRLIIIPDGMLNIIPFEFLVSGKGCNNDIAKPCFFGDQFIVNYYPSATILTFTRESIPQILPPQGSLFAVGDPIYGPDDKRLDQSQISFLLKSAKKYESELTLRGSRFRKGAEDKGYTFDRLIHSGLEVQKIRNIFENRSGDKEVLIGADASENQIKSRDLTKYQYLHFAVHGILAFDIPYLNEPALVLAVDPDTKEDGFLTLSEIYGLKLNADLVTLSACKTGLGLRVSGEGVIGLSRAFMIAGARSVLVSLWEVADESTALFMEEFYRKLVQGIDKVEALKKAKEYLRMKGYENPYFWAPFILIGD